MKPVQELIVDAYGCSADLSDAKKLEKASREAVLSVGASIATSTCHAFQPHGLTLCLILKESHFILSTWPEHGLAIMNIFLCNPEMDAKKVWKKLQAVLKPTRFTMHHVDHLIASDKKAA